MEKVKSRAVQIVRAGFCNDVEVPPGCLPNSADVLAVETCTSWTASRIGKLHGEVAPGTGIVASIEVIDIRCLPLSVHVCAGPLAGQSGLRLRPDQHDAGRHFRERKRIPVGDNEAGNVANSPDLFVLSRLGNAWSDVLPRALTSR